MFIATKKYLKVTWGFCLDVLFPKPELVVHLESLSASDILSLVPITPVSANESFRVLFNYETPLVRQLIWILKYSGSTQTGLTLGNILAENLLEDISDEMAFGSKNKIILVPIPLGPIAFEKRGYNQSEIICEGMVAFAPEIFELHSDILYKKKETPKQSKTKNKEERLENLKDSFGVRPELKSMPGRTILLIDDVVTTGETMREAVRTLKSAGARKIICYAIAH